MSDDELVDRIRQGDADAAEALVRRWYPAILRYCRRCCASAETAEDLTQETFLRLFAALPRYKKNKRFRAFLYTIADHLCIDESRRRCQYPLEDEQRLPAGPDPIRQAEDRDELNALLAALSPEQRQAVLLRYGAQLTFRQIAQVTGCGLRTAQSRVRWALKIMRQVKDDEK